MWAALSSETPKTSINHRKDTNPFDGDFNTKNFNKNLRFSRPGLPFNSLLHVGIGFLNEENSKNGLLGDLDESQIHSIEIEGSAKSDRSILNGRKLNLKKVYNHRITKRDNHVTIKVNFLNGSSLIKNLKVSHGDVLWL